MTGESKVKRGSNACQLLSCCRDKAALVSTVYCSSQTDPCFDPVWRPRFSEHHLEQRELAVWWPLPSSQKVKAGIRYLFQLCICYSKTCLNSSTCDHVSLFYQSSFDALITNISAKLLDMLTNNKQRNKLWLSLLENGKCLLHNILLIKYKNK